MKKAHCHACRNEVFETPRVCPHCAAPNPTFEYNVTKPIVVVVSAIILMSLFIDLLHSRKPEYVTGQTYPIAKNGVVCLTLNGLAKANRESTATPDDLQRLGCLPLAPDQDALQAKVLDTNETAVKVLVLAKPTLPLNDFQGWTAADNLDPEAVAIP